MSPSPNDPKARKQKRVKQSKTKASFGHEQIHIQEPQYATDLDYPSRHLPQHTQTLSGSHLNTTGPFSTRITKATGVLPTIMSMPGTTKQPAANTHITRTLPETQETEITGQFPAISLQISNRLPVTTAQFPHTSPRITKQFPLTGTSLPTRTLTRIPITEKRSVFTSKASSSRKRRPLLHVGILFICLLMLTIATFLVAPLDNGQGALAQNIGTFFSSGSINSFSPIKHMPTPTPTPALLTNEGSCGGRDIWAVCAKAVNDAGTMGTGKMQPPLSGEVITQAFGVPEYQTWCSCVKPHSGIDLAAAYGADVKAADSGQVIWVGWDWSGLGWAVKISHGNYIATIYGHLARYIVNIGDNVTKGQTIAYEGSTGASTGPHLHFMVLNNNRWVNPTGYMTLP